MKAKSTIWLCLIMAVIIIATATGAGGVLAEGPMPTPTGLALLDYSSAKTLDSTVDEVERLRQFLLVKDSYGYTNAWRMSWSADNPSTWKGVTWADNSRTKIAKISLPTYCDLVGKLDLSGFDQLTYVYFYQSLITELDVSGCVKLESLTCGFSRLTSLNLSGCVSLTFLQCNNNSLSSLDLSGLSALKRLHCNNNDLSQLDLRDFSLEYLDCNSNRVASLNLSGSPDLEALYCHDNFLSVLNLSQNTKLKTVYAGANPLVNTSAFIKSLPATVDCYAYSDAENTYVSIDKPPLKMNVTCIGHGYVSVNVYDADLDLYVVPDPDGAFLFWEAWSGLSQPKLSGNSKYYDSTVNAREVSITAVFSIIPDRDKPAPRKAGDVTGDNKTDIFDIIAVRNAIFGTKNDAEADVDGDGKIDIFDIILIRDYIFGAGQDPNKPVPTPGTSQTPGTCDTCHGTSKVTVQCSTCQGEGKVSGYAWGWNWSFKWEYNVIRGTYENVWANRWEYYYQRINCDTCNGNKTVERACPDCQ